MEPTSKGRGGRPKSAPYTKHTVTVREQYAHIVEWAKQQRGGLSAIIEDCLRERYQQSQKYADRTSEEHVTYDPKQAKD